MSNIVSYSTNAKKEDSYSLLHAITYTTSEYVIGKGLEGADDPPQVLYNCKVLVWQEFVVGLSLLLRGSFQEKLEWTFSLYDVNGDGVITFDEMSSVISSVYDIMGSFADPRVDEQTIASHTHLVFEVNLNFCETRPMVVVYHIPQGSNWMLLGV